MQKLHKSIEIKANKQKVWFNTIDPEAYKIWTKPFNPGSFYEGGWNTGDTIRFYGPDEQGNTNSGMIAQIAESRPFEYISIEHKGMINNGVEDYDSEQVKKWLPAFENYTFVEKGPNLTEFVVDLDIDETYKEDMENMWDQALIALKELCEKPAAMLTAVTTVNKPIEQVWQAWTDPEAITKWNFADESWECPKATNDLRVGGRFSSTMAAKDGSASFDFTGTYTKVEPHKTLEYVIDDGRVVRIKFESVDDTVVITEEFEAETTNSHELQMSGWQAIMNNFKQYCESK